MMERLRTKAPWLERYLFLVVACFIYALALDLFLQPASIVAGGATGAAILVNAKTGLAVGMVSIAINLPILLLGLKTQGLKFILRCFLTNTVLGVITDLLAFLPQVTDQPLLGALYGGVLQGAAIGLFVKYAVSSGGTELLGRVLRPLLPGLTIPQVIALLDGAVVLAGAVVLHNPENVLYALIVILVSSRVSDMVITGFAKSKLCYIITDRPEEVADLLLQNSPRGITNLNGTGMYARAPKGVLMTCVKARQLGQLKQLVSAVDPDAFVIVSETTEVLGKGFKQIDEE